MKFNITDNKKSTIFSTIIKQLKSFTGDTNIYFYKDKFYIQFLDSNHICLCEIVLSKQWFDFYNSKQDDIIGLNTEILQKVIKCKQDNDHIEFNYHNNDDKLHISFHNMNEKNVIEKSFEVPLIDLNSELLNIPTDNESQTDIKISSNLFFHLINELALFSDTLTIDINENEINMISDGDSGKYNINVDIDKIEEFSIDEGALINASFSIKYFTMISSLSKISDFVNLSIGENKPMIIMFNIDDKDFNVSDSDSEISANDDEPINFVRFFLAPKAL
jgi:proliferating cell nuclear antigen